MSAVIKTTELQLKSGKIGQLTLGRAQAFNAIDYAFYREVLDQLMHWQEDPEIVAVLFDSSIEKAFSAGGDVKWVTRVLQKENGQELGRAFFALEYFVDHFVRTFPKPTICWANGITMGAGIGLMNGCTHRIVSETSVLAMPEVKIGLFPDVGASYFLNRLPVGVGLFMGLTAAKMSGEDSLAISLADFFISENERERVLMELQSLELKANEPAENSLRLTDFFDSYSQTHVVQEAPIMDRMAEITELMDQDTLKDIDSVLRDWQPSDPYFKECKLTYEEACPTSVNVFYQLLLKAPREMEAAYAREWNVAAHFCNENYNFIEGVRALLVDKDNDPNWKPSRLSRVTGLDDFFTEKPGYQEFLRSVRERKVHFPLLQ